MFGETLWFAGDPCAISLRCARIATHHAATPHTTMQNNSGDSVAALAKYYKVRGRHPGQVPRCLMSAPRADACAPCARRCR